MLLDEIISILSDTNGSLTGALLNTKVLLHKIGRKDLVPWVNHELTGYPDANVVPEYRVVSTEVRGNMATFRLITKDQPLPTMHLKDSEQKFLSQYSITNSLQVIEGLIEKNHANGDWQMRVNLPIEFTTLLTPVLGPGVVVLSAWRLVNFSQVSNILAEVRSRLLDFVLNLQDVVGTDENKLSQESVREEAGKIFDMTISGSGNAVYVTNQSIQIVTINAKGDIDGLVRALAKTGIPDDELIQLRAAIAEDEGKGLVPVVSEGKTGHWFSKLLGRAANKTIDISVDLISSTVAKTLAAYGGIEP